MTPETMDQIIRHIDFNDNLPDEGKTPKEIAMRAQETSPLEVQVGGDHYKKLGLYQPWEVAAAWLTPEELRGAMKFTVISYLAREQDKGGDKDIEKALHTIQLWQAVRKDK